MNNARQLNVLFVNQTDSDGSVTRMWQDAFNNVSFETFSSNHDLNNGVSYDAIILNPQWFMIKGGVPHLHRFFNDIAQNQEDAQVILYTKYHHTDLNIKTDSDYVFVPWSHKLDDPKLYFEIEKLGGEINPEVIQYDR